MTNDTMKGAALMRRDGRYSFEVRDMPLPPVGAGEVLVRVHASAISHMCEAILDGQYDPLAEGLRAALGQDVLTGIEFSGVVASDGARFARGDEVIGYIAILRDRRAHAEYIAIAESALAPKPKALTHVEAASMPANALTARQALTQVANVKAGDRVLIIGAAGSVGGHAVQLARHLGAHVVGVCNPAVMDKVAALGAHEIVGYDTDIAAIAPGFDLVLDAAPAHSFAAVDPLIAPGGMFITTLPSEDPEGPEQARAAGKLWGDLMVLEVPGDGLNQTSVLIDQGAMSPIIDSVFPLGEVAAAHARFSQKGKVGKVVIEIA